MSSVIHYIETQIYRIPSTPFPVFSNHLFCNKFTHQLLTKEPQNTHIFLTTGIGYRNILFLGHTDHSETDGSDSSERIVELRGRIRRQKYRNIIKKLNIRRYAEEAYNNRRELIRRAYSLHGLDFDKLLSIKHSQ
ncbi:hypothetical protein BMR1_02g00800 [Babesia microti strain RI]|uniref:Uncharacterized protein n=1 Tax=Babesia microti (strain RI) TaxID=1133968 RepID=I7IPY6_BABMR|nr:hypothetical protein BMR1_02g00800 [Babesia microti strain RI]CCF73325.1 hypothetical protein BMR1_02g00800 [Babesia microti strain RI]|eukprot:XP_012647934.1 hypothetical protein BMR1_02g00800 [Babesia microti strain RI]